MSLLKGNFGITYGLQLDADEANLFYNIDKVQISKGDCAHTFTLSEDGTFERTENLYSLVNFSGKWKLEENVLTLTDAEEEEGKIIEYKIKSMDNEKVEFFEK